MQHVDLQTDCCHFTESFKEAQEKHVILLLLIVLFCISGAVNVFACIAFKVILSVVLSRSHDKDSRSIQMFCRHAETGVMV